MTEEFDDDDLDLDTRTAALLATVRGVQGRACGDCGHTLCGHDAVLAIVLGYKSAPRCSTCIAGELREPPAALRERSLAWISRRECFLHAWHMAGEAEGQGRTLRPACLFGAAATGVAGAATAPTTTTAPAADADWDAGDLGCGDLVLELRFRLRELSPGSVLHVTARDPAAPVDLPAWCGLCGHTLRHASHPDYWIEKKRD